jgi:hypothetical protein
MATSFAFSNKNRGKFLNFKISFAAKASKIELEPKKNAKIVLAFSVYSCWKEFI